jgi:hypothetical protein
VLHPPLNDGVWLTISDIGAFAMCRDRNCKSVKLERQTWERSKFHNIHASSV